MFQFDAKKRLETLLKAMIIRKGNVRPKRVNFGLGVYLLTDTKKFISKTKWKQRKSKSVIYIDTFILLVFL